MKPIAIFTTRALTALLSLGITCPSFADPDPYTPVGTLLVNPVAVQTGIKPNLDWDIEYPEIITDLVIINPDSSVVPKKKLRMDVRVVGAAWSNGQSYFDVDSYVRVSGQWIQLFYGKQYQINASSIRYSKVLNPGTRVDFAGRGNQGGNSWSSWMMTTTTNHNVKALTNGSSIPDYAPAYNQGNIAGFLTQFVDSTGRIILGPYDIIYLFDFNPYGQSGFDLQDLVVVVTFTEV